MDNHTNAFFEGIPSQITTNGPDVLSYQDQLKELTSFCDPEPKSLLNEPEYKPMPAAKASRFHSVIDVTYSEQRQAVVFTVYRPENPHTGSPKAQIKNLAIPLYKFAEMGFGLPGQWRYINSILNEVEFGHLEETPEAPDPFEDFVDPYADEL
jgi:hypothetical protein